MTSVNMLTHSFVGLRAPNGERLSFQMERALWQRGVRSVRDFLRCDDARLDPFKPDLQFFDSSRDLFDLNVFVQILHQKRDRWRLWHEFGADAASFDIETTGLNRQMDIVTSAVLRHDGETFCFVPSIAVVDARKVFEHDNPLNLEIRPLDNLPEVFTRVRLLLTYNGARFDIPFLQAKFPSFPEPLVHLDAMYNLRAAGLKGGQKNIEKFLGLTRDESIAAVRGNHAVELWNQYVQSGNLDALRDLITYNATDTLRLPTLMDVAYALNCRMRGFEVPLPSGMTDETISLALQQVAQLEAERKVQRAAKAT